MYTITTQPENVVTSPPNTEDPTNKRHELATPQPSRRSQRLLAQMLAGKSSHSLLTTARWIELKTQDQNRQIRRTAFGPRNVVSRFLIKFVIDDIWFLNFMSSGLLMILYIYIYIYIYIYAYTYTNIYTYIHSHTYKYIYTNTNAYVCNLQELARHKVNNNNIAFKKCFINKYCSSLWTYTSTCIYVFMHI